jgi:hypothetical protein
MYKYIWRLLMLLLSGVCIISCTSSRQPAVQLTSPTATTGSTALGSLFHRKHQQIVPPLPSKEHYTVLFNNMDGYWKHGQAVRVM